MAKAGFWLRGARGKLAGASMGKGQNGQTIIREIVTPKNPRTEKQLWQRAIMATVMQAYAAGKEIFDHSFQGYSVGSQCQREFVSRNARYLRELFAKDYGTQAAEEDCVANATAPKTKTVVPNKYIISSGSYEQSLFTETESKNLNIVINYSYTLPGEREGEKVAEYQSRLGIKVGDIYTFVFILTDPDAVLFNPYGSVAAAVGMNSVLRGSFGFVRLIVKDASNVATEVSEASLSDLFDVEQYNCDANIRSLNLNDSFTLSSFFTSFKQNAGYSIGLIHSRFDEDLRSNSEMHIVHNDEFGLGYRDVIPAWTKESESLGDPSVILEGSEEE